MAILSARYGLVLSDEVKQPYKQIMSSDRAKELAPQIAEKLRQYDYVIYFKAGARKEYLECMKAACGLAKKTLIALGYSNMGGINEIPKVIELVQKEELDALKGIRSLSIEEFG